MFALSEPYGGTSHPDGTHRRTRCSPAPAVGFRGYFLPDRYPSHQRNGLHVRRLPGHSFRRGAATWAASIGMSFTEIKTLRRRYSDCSRLYIGAGPRNTLLSGAGC